MAYLNRDGRTEDVIHSGNYERYVEGHVEQQGRRTGLVPRDYTTHPRGHSGMHAVDLPTIPRTEWSQRIKDMEASKSRLSDVRMKGNYGTMIPSRDQNGKGYCWAHSGTSAHLLLRARMGLPYVSLSAYAVACTIKQYQDEGGWGAQGVDFQRERGVPSEQFWPQQSMSKANDNPNTWANAALHKVADGWYDLAAAQYDRTLSWDQVMTCLLTRVPVVCDFNWWGHSVCGADPVDGVSLYDAGTLRAASGKLLAFGEFQKVWDMDDVNGGYGNRIWNSWGDSWSDQGMGTLAGTRAVPDGAVAPWGVLATAV